MADNIEVGDLVARISFDDTGLSKSMAEIDRQMKLVKSEFDKASTSLQGYGSEEDKLRSKSDALNQQLQLQQQRVNKLNEEFQRSVQEKGEDARETQNLATKLNQAQTASNKLESELKQVNKELEAQRKAAEIANSSWTKLGTAIDSAGQKLKSAGKEITNAGKTMSMRLTAPIVAAGAGILKAGLDFEEAMSKVQAISGATGDELQSLTDQAKNLGATTRFSASEAAAGMEFLARAGWEAIEIMDGMPGLLDLAAASAMDLGRAADITSNVMSAFGLAADTAGHVADVFAAAAANANTDVEQLGLAMTYLAPVANTLGWNLEEATAAVMKMSDAGIQGEKAGAAFATSLQRLAKPTKEMTQVMEDLDISFFDLEGNIKPLPQLIADLEKSTAGLTNEQKAAALSTIFGAEAYKNWAVLLDTGSASLEEATYMLIEADGAAKQMAETMQANGKGALTEMRSALEGLGITLSEYLIPAFTSIVQKITETIRWFNDLDPALQQTILAVAGIAAAIGPVLVVVGTLISSIGTIATAFGAMSTAIGAAGGATAVFGGALAAITGPVGIAVAAIAGITAVLVTLYNKNGDFRKFVDETWEAITKTLTDAWQAVLDFVVPLVDDMVAFFRDQFKKLQDFWAEHGEAILKIIKPALDLVEGVIKVKMEAAKTVINVAWTLIKGIISTAWEGIKLVVSSAIDLVIGVIKVALKIFQGDWKGAWEEVKNTTSNIWGNIETYMRNINLVQIGKDIMQGLINGIKSMTSAAVDAAKNVASGIGDGVKGFFGIRSPSRLMTEYGQYIGQGLALGMDKSTAAVARQAADLSAAAVPQIGGARAAQAPGVPGQAAGGAAGSLNFEGLFAGAIFNVRSDSDIRAIATELFNMQRTATRGAGA